MSFQTLEIELENGHVRTSVAEALPARAHALLTILSPPPAESNKAARSLGKACREWQALGWGEYPDLSTNKQPLDDFGK